MIGWASRDVTPDKPVNLLGQFHMRITDRIKDPLTVTALALSSGRRRNTSLIWMSCDVALIPDPVLEMCRRKLAKLAKDFPSENLVMNATHTHTAPDFGYGSWYPPVPEGVMKPMEYADFFTDRVAEAAAEAWKNRKHGFISYGIGIAAIGHGRRAIYFDDLSKRADFVDIPGMKTEKNARMYGETNDDKFDCIEGYIDHSAHFLFTFDEKKKLSGAVINVACTSQETEGIDEISADFWHEARIALRKKYGRDLFVLPQTSAAGGLSPHLMFNKKANQRMLDMKGIDSRQEIADKIKAAFDETFSWAKKDMTDSPELIHAAEKIKLPKRIVTKEEYLKNKKGLKELEETTPSDHYLQQESVLFSRKRRCQRILERYEEQKSVVDTEVELHVIRLGDLVFTTNPYELFTDYGIRIQARSPAVQTIVAQLCGGGRGCYLPTRQALKGESYSACVFCNAVGPEAGDKLVDETVALIKSLWEGKEAEMKEPK